MLVVVINHTLLLWFIRRQQRSFRWTKSFRKRTRDVAEKLSIESSETPRIVQTSASVYSVMESQDKFEFWFSLSCLGSCLELSCLILAQSHRQTNRDK